ncbi:MAG TPA: hypothetical protein DCS93_17060 [Microscillaceae bacterium]|nr:hypothetical protein [Microscillaceae bacterium]
MRKFINRFRKKPSPSPSQVWATYLEKLSAHTQADQASYEESSLPSVFVEQFWADYENRIIQGKKKHRRQSIQVTDASQKLLRIHHKFWKERAPNIVLESAQEFKNTGAGWHPVLQIAGLITLGFILVNLGFESFVLPVGALALVVFLYKIGAGGNRNLQQAIDDQHLVNYWLDLEPTHLVYEQLDNFDNHAQFVFPYHKIQALELTKEKLIIKPYNPETWWGKISGLFLKKRAIPAFIPEYEHICDFLHEVLAHNQQHQQFVKQLQDTYN